MIVHIRYEYCHTCLSSWLVKNGRDYKGAQKYYCKDCGAYGTLNPQPKYCESDKERIMRAYFERSSMRGVARIFGVARQTLARWLTTKARALPPLFSTLIGGGPDEILELDELWSFVHKKTNQRWLWIALCRRTRQIVAYVIGDRSEKSCRALWRRIPACYKRSRSYSDFWAAYQKVLPPETHQAVGKESGQTNHVERWNNTLRQRLARFVRKTLSFSKSERFHRLVLRLFIHLYNAQYAAIS